MRIQIFLLSIIIVLGVISIIPLYSDASGYSFVGVTSNGVTFPIEIQSIPNEKLGTGKGDGQAMIDGMGVQTRIIQKEYSAFMLHGTGMTGTQESIKPYIPVSGTSDFAALIAKNDKKLTYSISDLSGDYKLQNNILVNNTDTSNILGYSQIRQASGTNSVSLGDGGITVSGTGTIIIKLHDYTNRALTIRSGITDGNVKLVTQLEPSRELLMNPAHPLFDRNGNVFLRYDSLGRNGPGQILCEGFTLSTCTFPSQSYTFTPIKVPKDFEFFGTSYMYSPRMFTTNACYDPYTYYGTYITGNNNYSYSLAPLTRTVGDSTFLYGSVTPTYNTGLYMRGNYDGAGNAYYGCYQWQDSYFSMVSNIKLPVDKIFDDSSSFVKRITFPAVQSYLIVKASGSPITIHGSVPLYEPNLKINNVPPNTPYHIVTNGKLIESGMTSASGIIDIDFSYIKSKTNGLLHLYPDSLAYRGSFSTVIFDKVNNQTIHIDTKEDLAYTVHAYANFPVTGNVTITNMSLDGTLQLPYLNGNYTNGQNIMVPIVPKYHDIRMKINGVDVTTQFQNILGGTGVKIADPTTSTITKNNPGKFTNSIEATTGTTTYLIATSAGTAKAQLLASVSGTSTITNSKTLQPSPTPPPPPAPRDPLTTWVEVHVNGELKAINGKTKTQIYFSNTPTTAHSSGISGDTVYHTAKFTYPQVSVSGAISVPVNAGDFVEFYFYNKIYAEGSIPPTPAGFKHIGSSSTASATAVLHSASINTSM